MTKAADKILEALFDAANCEVHSITRVAVDADGKVRMEPIDPQDFYLPPPPEPEPQPPFIRNPWRA